MTKIKIYSRYDRPPKVACPLEAGSNVDKESGKFTDINYIVKRYVDTDGLSGIPVRPDYNQPIYGDFTKNYTINDALSLRENMQYLYDELSEEKRSQFKSFNDFLKKVGSSTDDEFVNIFRDSSTSDRLELEKNPVASATGSTSGSVQSTSDVNISTSNS